MNEHTAFIYLLCVGLICVFYGCVARMTFNTMREDEFPLIPALGLSLFWPFALIVVIISFVFMGNLDDPPEGGVREHNG